MQIRNISRERRVALQLPLAFAMRHISLGEPLRQRCGGRDHFIVLRFEELSVGAELRISLQESL